MVQHPTTIRKEKAGELLAAKPKGAAGLPADSSLHLAVKCVGVDRVPGRPKPRPELPCGGANCDPASLAFVLTEAARPADLCPVHPTNATRSGGTETV